MPKSGLTETFLGHFPNRYLIQGFPLTCAFEP
jgi:hypothetical protein